MTSLGDFLKTVKIFENLTEDELEILVPLLEVRNVKRGDRIITEGESSDLFYIIRRGHFTVSKGKEKEAFITVLGTRETFGEASLFHNLRRTANVTADEDSQILLLHRDQFQQFLLSCPIAANRIMYCMLKEIFLRLDETSQELQTAIVQKGAEQAIQKILR